MMNDAEREKIDDPYVGPTAYIGFVGIIATVLSILLVHGVYYAVEVGIVVGQGENHRLLAGEVISEADSVSALHRKKRVRGDQLPEPGRDGGETPFFLEVGIDRDEGFLR